MECSKCKFQNPGNMQFCGKCGSKLVFPCSHCNFINPENYSFCGKCGSDLNECSVSRDIPESAAMDSEKVQNSFSKVIKEKLHSQKIIAGEYKRVTLLFCDLKNFTPMVETLGPENAYKVMDQVYDILINTVHHYNGIVNEMTGDGIFALFGAPKAVEDAPLKAIRSSIEIHKQITKLNTGFRKEKKEIPLLQMRIGINSGPVVVGSLSNNLKSEFKVVGDAVNVASRLEELADPGTTNVSDEIFKLTEGYFRFESLGEITIKGKKNPQKVYRLISSSDNRTRFDVSAERGLTPLVGREREIDMLMDGFGRVKSGSGQVISLVSEAGIGKSRLLYEFRKTVSNEDVYFWDGRCLSYSKGISYHLIIDILKSNFHIQDDDDQIIRDKIKKGIKDIGLDENEITPYFLEILSVKNSGINTLLLSPDAMKDKLAEYLKLIIERLSKIRPFIMAVEDLHWADPSSIDILNLLFEVVPGARIFVIFTYRPEFIPTWGPWSFYSQINLYKLTSEQIKTMVHHILGVMDSDDEFVDFIINKTEGTPFYIEEFIKYLKEQNLIEKKVGSYNFTRNMVEIMVPIGIQDIIMARVDRVSEKAKQILKIGSVIEREFSYELIRTVAEYDESELKHILSELKESELIFERGILPSSVYIFKHALIREIVYESILSEKKKLYHELIGFKIEKLYGGKLPEYYEILSKHFIDGQNFEKGADYSRYSCKKMVKTASPHNAIKYAAQRIECLEKLQRNDDIEKQIIAARILLGLLYTQKNYHVPAMKVIQPILSVAENRGEKKKLSQIYTILGAYQYIAEDDFPQAFKYLKKALKFSEDCNDAISNMQASYWLGLGQALNCEFDEAEYNLNRVLEANQAFNILWGISSLKSVMGYFVYYSKGEIDTGFQNSLDAIKFADRNKDVYSKGMAHVVHGVMCYCKGFSDKAEKHLKAGIRICERSRFFSWNGMAQICLGELYYDHGEFDKSIFHFNELIKLTKKSEIGPSWKNFGHVGIARSKTARGDHNIRLDTINEYVDKIGIACFEGSKYRFLSEIYCHMGQDQLEKAIDLIQKAIQADTLNGMEFSLGKNYKQYAQYLKMIKEDSKANDMYKKTKEVFERCKADQWVEDIKSEITDI